VAAEPAARRALWEQAAAAAAQATEEVRLLIDTEKKGASVDTGDAAGAAAEVLAAASRLIEGDADGPLTQAARDYDRAARESRGRPVTGTAGGSALRAAALQMAQGGRRPGRSEAAQVALLVPQIGRLSISITRLREAQSRRRRPRRPGGQRSRSARPPATGPTRRRPPRPSWNPAGPQPPPARVCRHRRRPVAGHRRATGPQAGAVEPGGCTGL